MSRTEIDFMKDEIDVTPARINPVGQAVPEPEELSGDTQAMKECPRFDRCNAPICPLDPDVLDRVHAKGDSVCHYLRLYVKNALWGLKPRSLPANLPIRVAEVYPQLIARYGPLKDALERAAKSPPKGFTRGEQQ
jgi:hypothetical protein